MTEQKRASSRARFFRVGGARFITGVGLHPPKSLQDWAGRNR